MKRHTVLLFVFGLLLVLSYPAFLVCADQSSMQDFIDRYKNATPPSSPKEEGHNRIRAFIDFFTLPNTLEEEVKAQTDVSKASELGKRLWLVRLAPFHDLIFEASNRFNVPPAVIAGVIIIESGGNPRAKNPTSSACGLMQIINGTFEEIRIDLSKQGIHVSDRFQPRDAIFSGTYYLSKMYDKAFCSHPESMTNDRNDLKNWDWPFRYYFAGPYYEGKMKYVTQYRQKRIVYSNQVSIEIEEPDKYSRKGLRYSRFIDTVLKSAG